METAFITISYNKSLLSNDEDERKPDYAHYDDQSHKDIEVCDVEKPVTLLPYDETDDVVNDCGKQNRVKAVHYRDAPS